jgi:uncharacterized protein (DUF952 family)
MKILHITHRDTWVKAEREGLYSADTLEDIGFIHCCLPEQVEAVLTCWFKDSLDLVMLEIDTDRLRSRLVYENLEGGTDKFPHVYGPINLDAITNWKSIGEYNEKSDTLR